MVYNVDIVFYIYFYGVLGVCVCIEFFFKRMSDFCVSCGFFIGEVVVLSGMCFGNFFFRYI